MNDEIGKTKGARWRGGGAGRGYKERNRGGRRVRLAFYRRDVPRQTDDRRAKSEEAADVQDGCERTQGIVARICQEKMKR